ncbi:hypothetical protein [Oceanobacter kriegii]|uniref:hypothetical protein n=1 Tax=Oceanobacter kriegii TaxID=64972 RepID=UPI0004887B92|nr:hypothetical protein [Oceanobacter kriegii]
MSGIGYANTKIPITGCADGEPPSSGSFKKSLETAFETDNKALTEHGPNQQTCIDRIPENPLIFNDLRIKTKVRKERGKMIGQKMFSAIPSRRLAQPSQADTQANRLLRQART